jgi:hypothetical protein
VRAVEVNTRSAALEAALGELVRDRSGVPEEESFVALPATANGSFEVAFGALAEGVAVRRLLADATVDGAVLGAGSFIVDAGGGTASRVAELVTAADAPVRALDELPDASLATLSMPRVALVETWFHDMDAGWTRFLFDGSNIPHTVLRPAELAEIELADEFDVVVMPDVDPDLLLKGRYEDDGGWYRNDYPPEYQKGMGEKGKQKLVAFLSNGGTIVSWRRSTGLFTGDLTIGEGDDQKHVSLPVRDLSEPARKHGLLVPGAFLAVDVRTDHPLAWGMPASAGIFSRGTPVLGTTIPIFDTDRRVVVEYAKQDLLLSGYAEHPEELAGKPAAIWIAKAEGQLVLLTFNPQFRASTPITYKLLCNALLLPPLQAR